MATVWQWLQFRFSMPAPAGGGSEIDTQITIPNGRNVQRIISSGGFNLIQLVTGQSNGRKQSQAIVQSEFRIDAGPTLATQLTRTLQTFVWDRSGNWSSGSIADTNEAAGFCWATPPGLLNFDADVRFSGGGNGGVRVFCSYVIVGNATDGLVGPTGQANGALFVNILTSGG